MLLLLLNTGIKRGWDTQYTFPFLFIFVFSTVGLFTKNFLKDWSRLSSANNLEKGAGNKKKKKKLRYFH